MMKARVGLYRPLGDMTTAENERYATALVEMIEEIQPTHFMTSNFNFRLDLNLARRHLGIWAAQIDRLSFGPRYTKVSADERLDFVAIPEHLTSNVHFHIHARLPRNLILRSDWSLRFEFQRMWKRHVRPGNVHVERYRDRGAAQYTMKEMRFGGVIEHFILASEFHAS